MLILKKPNIDGAQKIFDNPIICVCKFRRNNMTLLRVVATTINALVSSLILFMDTRHSKAVRHITTYNEDPVSQLLRS
jgi:hypothetical protein